MLSSEDWSRIESEAGGYACLVNHILENVPEVEHLLPIESSGRDLLLKVKDGILLSALLASVKLDQEKTPLSLKTLHLVKKTDSGEFGVLNPFQISENHRKFLNACEALGIKLVNVGELDLMHGTEHPNLVLGVMRQVLHTRRVLLLQGDLEAAMVRKRRTSLMSIDAANIMITKFINHMLEQAGVYREIKNFHSDMADSVVLLHVLHLLSPETDVQPVLENPDLLERAKFIIALAKKIGVRCMIRPEDIVAANTVLIFDLAASIASCSASIAFNKARKSIYSNSSSPTRESLEIAASETRRSSETSLADSTDLAIPESLNPLPKTFFGLFSRNPIANKYKIEDENSVSKEEDVPVIIYRRKRLKICCAAAASLMLLIALLASILLWRESWEDSQARPVEESTPIDTP